MHAHLPIRTERLILRPWRPEDFAAFAALNADPAVMEHFPSVLARDGSDAMAHRIQERIERDGFGLFAVQVAGGADFVGFVGLNVPDYGADLPCGVCTEVGWRLARDAWGMGYATEAARACLVFGFEVLKLEEIVSFTATSNHRSQAVMRRIGMTRDATCDFDHPLLPQDHPLARHVLYRVGADGITSR
jgi:RimJ/RimL family protein N-acetyltransferase